MKTSRIHLNAKREVYMIAIFNLKTTRGNCQTSINDLNKTDFKVGDKMLLKNHTPTMAFDSKYKLSLRICM